MSIKDDTFEMLDNAPVKSKKSILLLVLLVLMMTGTIPFYLQKQSPTKISPVVHANEPLPPEIPASTPPSAGKNSIIKAVVNFDQVSAVIKPDQMAKLQTFYQSIKDMTGTIQIDGYTDNLGSEKEGAALSTQRSEAAAAYLKSLGISSKIAINISNYGEENPVADNSTESGRQQNRRVELTFTPAP